MRLTEQDLHTIINNAIEIVLENSDYSLRGELICRLPYFVTLLFTDHCIEREWERLVSEDQIISDASSVVKNVIEDFESGKLGDDEYFKIINRNTCVVTVCSIVTGRGRSKTGRIIKHIVAVTVYVWDGRINIDQGQHNYYIGEESDEYLAAKQWNEENQDKVLAYMDWKRGNDIRRQMRKADKEYYYRNNSTLDPETRMRLIGKSYDSQERWDKKQIHDAMKPSDFKAVQDYHKNMDKMPLSSKGSANRDLRAMDLRKIRKQQQKDENN